MTSPFDLRGRVAVVTGGNTGIGQGMALALAGAGCRVASVARRRSDDTVAAIEDIGGKAVSIQADLSSTEPLERILDETTAALGAPDILVNNAGIIRRADAVDFTETDWDDVMNVNLKVLFFLSQAFARRRIAGGGGGKIINTASMLSFQGGIRVPSYTASKSGVAGLTKLMAALSRLRWTTRSRTSPSSSTARQRYIRRPPIQQTIWLRRPSVRPGASEARAPVVSS